MRSLLLLVGLTGCLTPRTYECTTNQDCTGGAGGICEEGSRVCSFLDPSCSSGRRIGDYGGALSNTCTEARELTNACVAGEPWPTPGTPCTAQVCARIPSCCEVSWGEACVRAAETMPMCDVHCAKWIATTGSESHLLRWSSDLRDYESVGMPSGLSGVVAWVDAHEGGRPRLVKGRNHIGGVYRPTGADPPEFTEEALRFVASDVNAVLRAATAVDTNRDDSVEVGMLFGGDTGPAIVAMIGVDNEATTTNSATLGGSEAIAWADYTGDRIPDFAVGMVEGYRLYYFSDVQGDYVEDFSKQLTAHQFATMGWADLDGDGRLDLVAIGTFIAVHINNDPDNFAGTPKFSIRAPGGSGPSGMALAVGALGDMDGDGRADVVAANTELPKVGILVWNGAILVPTLFDVDSPLLQVALADVDDDGRLDVLGIDAGGLLWLRNVETPGGFTLEPARRISAAGPATSFAVTGWPATN